MERGHIPVLGPKDASICGSIQWRCQHCASISTNTLTRLTCEGARGHYGGARRRGDSFGKATTGES
eukprot:9237042-Prorocentrum_lima.AAC.1